MNYGRQLFAFENYPEESNLYTMVQVGYLKHDQNQHILTLYRSILDFDKAGTQEMLKDYEVEYLSVKEYLTEDDEAEFCFDHLIIKGELVVLVCERE